MIIGKDITSTSKLIKKSKGVEFSTETVYGLGVEVLNSKAVKRICQIKERPLFDPLIVLVLISELMIGIESKVIALVRVDLVLLRSGAITLSELEKERPKVIFHDLKKEKLSPGLLNSPYYPQKLGFFSSEIKKEIDFLKAGLISFGVPDINKKYK